MMDARNERCGGYRASGGNEGPCRRPPDGRRSPPKLERREYSRTAADRRDAALTSTHIGGIRLLYTSLYRAPCPVSFASIAVRSARSTSSSSAGTRPSSRARRAWSLIVGSWIGTRSPAPGPSGETSRPYAIL